MHDPSSVCFDISYPWKNRHGHRGTFLTVWHEDPLDFKGKCGCRDDDSCGWFRPPMTIEERDRVRQWAKYEYGVLFAKQVAAAEKKSYAYICFDSSCHEAIYWAWRYIKYEVTKAKGWRFLDRRNALSAGEIERIFNLASNPVDNLKLTHAQVNDVESFTEFFTIIYRSYQSYHRPWYRHPKWHVHHWSIQIHPLQKLKRWLFARCSKCGGRFGWNESAYGSWGGKDIWHARCSDHGPVMAASIKCEETTVLH